MIFRRSSSLPNYITTAFWRTEIFDLTVRKRAVACIGARQEDSDRCRTATAIDEVGGCELAPALHYAVKEHVLCLARVSAVASRLVSS